MAASTEASAKRRRLGGRSLARGVYRVAAAFACLTVAASAGAQEEFPYAALVFVEAAEVRCGPGDDFYVTGKLKRGLEVEVYRREANGWLGVRPPQGSFSWVPARSLRGTETTDVAEASEPDVVVWVGTSVESVQHHKWQVKLQPGERVEILNRKLLAPFAEAEPETWCMISPPAGEFRWVHSNAVRPKQLRLSEQELASHRVAPPEGDAATAPATPGPAASAGYAGPPPFEVDSTRGAASSAASNAGSGVGSALPPNLPAAAIDGAKTDFAGWTRDALDLELARRVIAPASQWRLDDLIAEAEKRKAETADPAEAVLWNGLIVRAKEFRLLQQKTAIASSAGAPAGTAGAAGSPVADASGAPRLRSADVPARTMADPPILNRLFSGEGWTSRGESDPLSTLGGRVAAGVGSLTGAAAPASQPAASPGPSAAASAVPAAEYDGTGFLMPVHRQSENVPPFALVSRDGRILRYVVPTPGLNLHRYARQEVGVFGSSRAAEGVAGGLLVAERIVELDRHR